MEKKDNKNNEENRKCLKDTRLGSSKEVEHAYKPKKGHCALRLQYICKLIMQ